MTTTLQIALLVIICVAGVAFLITFAAGDLHIRLRRKGSSKRRIKSEVGTAKRHIRNIMRDAAWKMDRVAGRSKPPGDDGFELGSWTNW